MTEQQRKAIEILNGLRLELNFRESPVISEDDYFFLMSFVIDRPQAVYIPVEAPGTSPVIQPYLTPGKVTCGYSRVTGLNENKETIK